MRGMILPEDLAALSIEVIRSPDEAMDRAVGEASAVFRSSLAALGIDKRCKLWLVVSSAPLRRNDKVAAYRASHEKVWGVLERRGIAIPEGTRRELEVSLSDNLFVVVGSIELYLGGLSLGLEMTRFVNAICLVTDQRATDPMFSIVSRHGARLHDGTHGLLLASVQSGALWNFVARAFGEFDDHLVGVEVFARDAHLDILASALQ